MGESAVLTSIHDTELFRVGTPRKIMNGTLLIERDTAIKIACGTQEIHTRFAVVAFVRIVDLGLR
jgi:hypothetical protein